MTPFYLLIMLVSQPIHPQLLSTMELQFFPIFLLLILAPIICILPFPEQQFILHAFLIIQVKFFVVKAELQS